MKIRIHDVGRMKRETTIEVADEAHEDDVAHAIQRAVVKMKALMSRDIVCTWDPASQTGAVLAGWREVGRAAISPDEDGGGR